MGQFLRIIFLFALIIGCTTKEIEDPELDYLVALLVGEFSNKEQAKNDNGFVHLNLINKRIWKDRPGYWIYTEVYDSTKDNYVYIQRILNYQRVDSSIFKNTSYRITNAEDYKGRWKEKDVFDKLTLDSLKIRAGCEVYFEKNTSTIYTGKTKKNHCTSSISNVEYLTTNLIISNDKISLWNRGYDNKRKQVWGKIQGPYKYKRMSSKRKD